MRTRLTLLATAVTLGLSAQVHMDVLQPAELVGSYSNTWAPPNTIWGTPDMNDPLNRTVGELALVSDGTPGDTLGCNPLVNASEIAGKVAVIYRGSCSFVSKAQNCFDAGAIGVLMINNAPGGPVGMGGTVGAGLGITIPVFMIGQADGALLRAAMDNGTTVEVLLGNKDGYYINDIGFTKSFVVRPQSASTPSWLATDPGDLSIPLGAFIRNFGSGDNAGSTLRGVITQNGDTLYNETAPVATLIPSDTSDFVALPDFVLDAYSGRYTLTYSVSTDTEESPGDNSYTMAFDFGDLYSKVPLDAVTGLPRSTQGIKPGTPDGEFETCIVLQDPNASRIALTGIHFYGAKNAGTMEGELIISKVHLWNDIFTGISDPAFGFLDLSLVHTQEHNVVDTGRVVQSYLPFQEAVMLDNNARYLVCITATNTEVFFGANDLTDFNANYELNDQPVQANRNGAAWFLEFTGGQTTSHAVSAVEVSTIGIDERAIVELAPYPNPTTGVFQVPLKGHGATTITVMDAAGRAVATHRTSNDLYTLDLRGEAPGMYLVSIQSDKGRGVGRLILE